MIVLNGRAYGKLNLTLDILDRRPDGYHNLRSVMTKLDLWDEVQVELETGKPWQLCCQAPGVPTDSGNLCWKAAEKYFAAAGIAPPGLTIRLQKRLPSQAGMAGGSADAAAVLELLNGHYNALPFQALTALCAAVGSDVPFCLSGPTALVEGKGELVRSLPALPKQMVYVLVQPEFSVPTPALFRQLDACPAPRKPGTDAMLAAIDQGGVMAICQALSNDFQPLVEKAHPVVGKIRRELYAQGAKGTALTGTGSVVYGIFTDMALAEKSLRIMELTYPWVRLVRQLAG